MLIQTGIPSAEDILTVTPSEERFAKGPVAIAECFQKIPCNPCMMACVKKAIRVEPDINQTPRVDFDVCNGCGVCLTRCPGLAIFIVDKTYSDTEALIKEMGWFPVVKVIPGSKTNKTCTICLAVPKDLAMEVRNIRAGGYQDGR